MSTAGTTSGKSGGEPVVEMTLQGLLEQSVLDAMGLLDEPEREAFETAFGAASPQAQAQIRREQARMADQGMLLPDVEAPADLRARVIEAWRRAAEEETETVRHSGGPRELHSRRLRRSRRVAPVWRAAALGFFTASVVLTAAMIHFQQGMIRLELQRQDQLVLDQMIHDAGPSFAEWILTDPASERTAFHAVDGGDQRYAPVNAQLWTHPDSNRGLFSFAGLQPEEGVVYQLVAEDPDGVGRPVILADLQPSGGKDNRYFDLSKVATGSRLAVHAVRHIGGSVDRVAVMVAV